MKTPDQHPFNTSSSECDDALRQLHHLLSGELTDDRRERIQQHLQECAPCAEPYDFYGELRRVLQERCRDQVPPNLLGRIRSSLDLET